jgi:hypothetical protein
VLKRYRRKFFPRKICEMGAEINFSLKIKTAWAF